MAQPIAVNDTNIIEFQEACGRGNLEIVKKYLEAENVKMFLKAENQIHNHKLGTALHIAIIGGGKRDLSPKTRKEVIKALCDSYQKNNVDINENLKGLTAFEMADKMRLSSEITDLLNTNSTKKIIASLPKAEDLDPNMDLYKVIEKRQPQNVVASLPEAIKVVLNSQDPDDQDMPKKINTIKAGFNLAIKGGIKEFEDIAAHIGGILRDAMPEATIKKTFTQQLADLYQNVCAKIGIKTKREQAKEQLANMLEKSGNEDLANNIRNSLRNKAPISQAASNPLEPRVEATSPAPRGAATPVIDPSSVKAAPSNFPNGAPTTPPIIAVVEDEIGNSVQNASTNPSPTVTPTGPTREMRNALSRAPATPPPATRMESTTGPAPKATPTGPTKGVLKKAASPASAVTNPVPAATPTGPRKGKLDFSR